MKIKILRGTDEIGGSCVEVSTKNTTLLLDYGTALAEDSEDIALPQNINAVLISHPHQDHYGEILQLTSNIPVYCGERSLHLINAARIFTGKTKITNDIHFFDAWKEFKIGDFSITPFLVDHSAPDAYAFLIKADNQQILYSGDFRANGRKQSLFKNMCKARRLKNLDAVIMEGTMMQRNNADFPNEESVKAKIYNTLKSNDYLSAIICSSQNIDRIVSAYKACVRANKFFVVDIYTAWILEIANQNDSVPNISWENIKVFKNFGGSYYTKIKADKAYFKDFTNRVFEDTVSMEKIKANPSKYFLKISPYHIERVLRALEIDNINIIYSQWLGYLKEEFSTPRTVELYANLKAKSNWTYAHTSGHADLEALTTFAKALKPKAIIPIHTEYKEKFKEHFDNVLILNDNEEYKIKRGDTMDNPFKRGLSKKALELLKTGRLKPILKKIQDHNGDPKNKQHQPENKDENKDKKLSLNIRDNYINIYYNGGCLAKIDFLKTTTNHSWNANYYHNNENKEKFSAKATDLGIKDKPELEMLTGKLDKLVDIASFTNSWTDKMSIMSSFNDNKKKERAFQQNVEYYNNLKDDSFIIVDTEYTISSKITEGKGFAKTTPRLDMIALEKADNGKYKLVLIENKCGYNSSSGSSGIEEHLKDMYALVNNQDLLRDFKENIQVMANQLIELGLIACREKAIEIDMNEYKVTALFMMDKYWKEGKLNPKTSTAIQTSLKNMDNTYQEKLDIKFLFLGTCCGKEIDNKYKYIKSDCITVDATYEIIK